MYKKHSTWAAFALSFILFGVLALLVSQFWVGFIASDDANYLANARRLLAGGEFPADNHFGQRYTVILPLMVIEMITGMNEWLLATPVFVALFAIISATVFSLRNVLDSKQIGFGLIIFVTSPLVVIQTSILNVDLIETALIALSLLAFFKAIQTPEKIRFWMFAAGLAASLTYVNRETGLGLLGFYGLLFLVGAFVQRRDYFYGLAGYIIVPLIEAVIYLANGSHPLDRFLTARESHLSGGSPISFNDYTAGSGNITDDRYLGSLTAIFFNEEFSLIFFFVVASVLGLWRLRNQLENSERQLFILLSLFTIIWFLWLAVPGFVRPLPRYFSPMVWSGAILVGMWLGRKNLYCKWTWILVALLLLGNVAGLSLEDTKPRQASRLVAETIIDTQEPVWTDRKTENKAKSFVGLSHPELEDLVKTGEPAPDGLIVLVSTGGEPKSQAPEQLDNSEQWSLIEERPAGHRLIGSILEVTGVSSWLPDTLRQKLTFADEKAMLYRLGQPND